MILKDEGHGTTDRSLDFFRSTREQLGEIIRIEALESTLQNGDSRLYTLILFDGRGNQMWLSGCNCGYRGTGPQGMRTILEELDFGVTLDEIAKFSSFTVGAELSEV